MTGTSGSPIRPEMAPKRADFLVPALVVSIVIATFAVVTQFLSATSATLLSTTQILTVWLVALGLIAALWIIYMICQAYVTARAEKAEAEQARERLTEALAAKAATEQALNDAQDGLNEARRDAEHQKERAEEAVAGAEQAHAEALKSNELLNEALVKKATVEQALKDAQDEINRLLGLLKSGPGEPTLATTGESPDGTGGGDEDAWVPPDEFRYLDGSAHSVRMEKVFPFGCYLEPDSFRLDTDKPTDQPVYQCRILDLNPALKDRPHETVVKIPADQQPSLPSMPRFGWVKFDDLTITAYVKDRSQMRIRYALRAKKIRPAAATAARFPAMWTAASQ